MTTPFSGGCACGAIRWECSAEPQMVAHCFCTDCQKTSGAQMTTNLLVPKQAFNITKGTPKTCDFTADSGNTVRRHFCGNCGSQLASEPLAMEGLIVIKAGSLDDSSWLNPSVSIYTDSAPRWAVIPEGLPTFPKMPPMGGD